MTNDQMTTPGAARCEMQWITVQDRGGRTHLEARWIDPTAPLAICATPAA